MTSPPCPRWRRWAPPVLVGSLLLGCAAAPDQPAAAPATPSPGGAVTTSAPPPASGAAAGTPTPSGAAAGTPPASGAAAPGEPAGTGETAVASPPPTGAAPHPVSLPALMARRYDGRDLRLGRVLARTAAYTRYAVSYTGAGLTITGILNRPTGRGPFPVLVLLHGYIDPAVYTTGRGLRREQDYLARRGYVVLHVDYRNHAGSDDDPANERTLRLGYTEDAVNAVLAVQGSRLPYLDPDRVGLLGRSMGGGVALNALVVAPGLVDAAVVFAPVSADAVDNFDRWTRGQPGRRRLAERIVAAYGSPESNPDFWRGVSASSYLDRVSEPLLVHHGTADDTVPIQWSRATVAALRGLGKDATLVEYDGEGHAFGPQWTRSMRRTVEFLERNLAG